MAKLSYAQVRELIKYDSETGLLTWLPRRTDIIPAGSSEKRVKAWNLRYAGTEALSHVSIYGYKQGHILGKDYKAHRVAWLLHYGEWPEQIVDHCNGVKTDNRISNLRNVTPLESNRNLKRPVCNKSGVIGVHFYPPTNRWCAQIRVNHVSIALGYFKELDDARAARKQAEIKYGFHENHGRD